MYQQGRNDEIECIDLVEQEEYDSQAKSGKFLKVVAGVAFTACVGVAAFSGSSTSNQDVEGMFAVPVNVMSGVNVAQTPISKQPRVPQGTAPRAGASVYSAVPQTESVYSSIPQMQVSPRGSNTVLSASAYDIPETEALLAVEDMNAEMQEEQTEIKTAGAFGVAAAACFLGSKLAAKQNAKVSMLATAGAASSDSEQSWVKTAKLGTLFFLWYALNIAYNITNKKVLNAVSLPWMQSTLSLWMGVPLVLLMWLTGVRKAPKLSKAEIGKMAPIAAMHAVGHLAAVISFAWGAVSFTQIVKAAEPVFTAGLSGVFLGQVFHPAVYAALLPVIGGVAIASLGELSFSALAFAGAMISNLTFALRAILSKKILGGKGIGENMNASNIYAVMTILAAIISTPLAIWQEGGMVAAAFETANAAGGVGSAYIIKNVILSGLTFFLYNEVAFQALDQVNAVTHAVANTIKRVAIIMASVVIFGTPMTPVGMLGSGVAIAGVLIYSLMKNKYPGTDYGKKKEEPKAVEAPTETPPPATA